MRCTFASIRREVNG